MARPGLTMSWSKIDDELLVAVPSFFVNADTHPMSGVGRLSNLYCNRRSFFITITYILLLLFSWP